MPRSRASSSSGTKSHQDNEGHYQYTIGQVLNSKYTVKGFLGDGTFGRVLLVEDTDGVQKAVKVIRAVERYVEAGKIEAEIIQKLNKADPGKESNIVRLFDHFPLGNNYCLVFEKLGKSLFDVIKENGYKGRTYAGFRMAQVQQFAKQMVKSLAFMHSLGLTHTDLKPENILLVNDEMKWDEEKRANYPTDCSIRIIDFGGSTFHDEYHTHVINTRQYRAPEVILELGWDMSSDMWSLGCILVELYVGELLFPTHKDSEHLAMMRKLLGRFPTWMGKNCSRTFRKYFDRDYRLDFPYAFSESTVRNVDRLPYLEVSSKQKLIRKRYDDFINLIYDLLEFDPARRLKPREALRHQFFYTHY